MAPETEKQNKQSWTMQAIRAVRWATNSHNTSLYRNPTGVPTTSNKNHQPRSHTTCTDECRGSEHTHTPTYLVDNARTQGPLALDFDKKCKFVDYTASISISIAVRWENVAPREKDQRSLNWLLYFAFFCSTRVFFKKYLFIRHRVDVNQPIIAGSIQQVLWQQRNKNQTSEKASQQ